MCPGYTTCIWLTSYWSENTEDNLLLAISLFCLLLCYSLTPAVDNISSTSGNPFLSHNAFLKIFAQSSLPSFHPTFAHSSSCLSCLTPTSALLFSCILGTRLMWGQKLRRETPGLLLLLIVLCCRRSWFLKKKNHKRDRMCSPGTVRPITLGMDYYAINLVTKLEDVNL